MKSSGNILVYRTGQLGDAIVSLPAIRAIREGFPGHRLFLLTTQHPDKKLISPWEILGPTGLFEGVIFHEPLRSGAGVWFGLLKVMHKIRRLRPEILFWLREVPWPHVRRDRFIFQVLCGIEKSFGLEFSVESSARTGASIPRLQTETDRMMSVVESAGVSIPAKGRGSFGFPVSEREKTRVDAIWYEARIPEDAPVIALGPVSKMPAKRWPIERFVELAKRLVFTFPEYRLMVFGGAGDRYAGIVLKHVLQDRLINLAGRLTVLESAEAIRRCRLYVGNDTGIMHLAAAVGTPCVAIFSARDFPGRWDPYGPNHVVLRRTPPCSGCFLQVCKEHDMVCLKDIQVDEVAEAVFKKLRSDVGEVCVSKG